MPYKDPEQQRRAQREWHLRTWAERRQKQAERRKTPEGKAAREAEYEKRRKVKRRPLKALPGCYLCGEPCGQEWTGHVFGLCGQPRCVEINRWWFGRGYRRVPYRQTPHLLGLHVLACYLEYIADEARKALRALDERPARSAVRRARSRARQPDGAERGQPDRERGEADRGDG